MHKLVPRDQETRTLETGLRCAPIEWQLNGYLMLQISYFTNVSSRVLFFVKEEKSCRFYCYKGEGFLFVLHHLLCRSPVKDLVLKGKQFF